MEPNTNTSPAPLGVEERLAKLEAALDALRDWTITAQKIIDTLIPLVLR